MVDGKGYSETKARLDERPRRGHRGVQHQDHGSLSCGHGVEKTNACLEGGCKPTPVLERHASRVWNQGVPHCMATAVGVFEYTSQVFDLYNESADVGRLISGRQFVCLTDTCLRDPKATLNPIPRWFQEPKHNRSQYAASPTQASR